MSKIYFLKVRDVKTPVRGTPKSAGIDFFVPNYNTDFLDALHDKNEVLHATWHEMKDGTVDLKITLEPHERILIPSGIKVFMEDQNCALIAANKSGVATKKGLIFGAQVVDADYTGEVHISVINTTNEKVELHSGDKIIQFIQTPVVYSNVSLIENEDTFLKMHEGTERGDGGFGSTGTK